MSGSNDSRTAVTYGNIYVNMFNVHGLRLLGGLVFGKVSDAPVRRKKPTVGVTAVSLAFKHDLERKEFPN